jgi:hypothetical protein
MQRSRVSGLKAIMIVAAAVLIAAGLLYTGIHNYNLFRRALPDDQQVFALVPVLLLEGSIVLFLVSSFVWFSIGAQKALAGAFGWALFAIVGLNTLVDSLTQSASTIPAWLGVYATLMLPVTPVMVVAMWKLILDTDPAKRRLDMQKTIAGAIEEAKYQAAQRALMSEANRAALIDYGAAYSAAIAASVRDSAPAQIPVRVRRVDESPIGGDDLADLADAGGDAQDAGDAQSLPMAEAPTRKPTRTGRRADSAAARGGGDGGPKS